jgi:putative Mg2+ transporter-C (MgtC) family protein
MDIEIFCYRLAVAFLFGVGIGVERQWHQKMAGLRTNVLVTVGSASFVALSELATHGVDPTRIAAQIVSGIGFLGAGVIMRDGFNVHGLNTAATLWCSAAVGTLAGTGYLAEGAVATLVIVLANALLRPASDFINHHFHSAGEAEIHYRLTLIAAEAESAKLRADLLEQLNQAGLGLQELKSSGTSTPGEIEIGAMLVSPRRNDAAVEKIIGRLSLHPQISDAKWQAVNAMAAQS